MALRMDGDWHVGDGPADLDAFLEEIGAEGYDVHEIRHAACGRCAAGVFGIAGDPMEGTMRRTCRQCDAEHFVAGSGDYWSDEDIQTMVCVCEGEGFQVAVGYSLYPNGKGIRSLATAERCAECGRIGSFTQWMVRGGEMDLLDLA
jgi:hypothetical protein